MPRFRSPRIEQVKAKLILRLRDGFYSSGQRFFSNRDLTRRFGVSYQTAHRLTEELVSEGWLVRRPASGTFVTGKQPVWAGVELIFATRAQRPDSFGQRLHGLLGEALDKLEIVHRTRWTDAVTASEVPANWFPLLWENSPLAFELAAQRRYVVILGDRPKTGLAASYMDAVTVDDYAGGVIAGEIFRQLGIRAQVAILAGPMADARNRLRISGFLSVYPRCKVIKAGSWFFEPACRVAGRTLSAAAVFAVNDRLASAVCHVARQQARVPPALVGFDDAPVAERENFTSVAFPWNEITSAAVQLARLRMQGSARTACALVYAPRPVVRS